MRGASSDEGGEKKSYFKKRLLDNSSLKSQHITHLPCVIYFTLASQIDFHWREVL